MTCVNKLLNLDIFLDSLKCANVGRIYKKDDSLIRGTTIIDILRLFDTLPNFIFSTSEVKRDLKKRCMQTGIKLF